MSSEWTLDRLDVSVEATPSIKKSLNFITAAVKGSVLCFIFCKSKQNF